MIIFRYLSREVLLSFLAVTLILLLIISSGRFIAYLSLAASGKVASSTVIWMLIYRLPSMLELILPLGILLGFLLSYGRLYLESEMTVLESCGMGRRQLLLYSMGPATLVCLLVALLSLWLTPLGYQNYESLVQRDRAKGQLDTIAVGQFQFLGSDGRRVLYTDHADKSGELGRIFFAEQLDQGRTRVTVASYGQRYTAPDSKARYLLLSEGARYEGIPGHADYQATLFQSYGVQMRQDDGLLSVPPRRAESSLQLWRSDDAADHAHLYWRLSLPVVVLVMLLLAVPLSRVNPRQGRYARLLPAILLYLAYISALSALLKSVEEGEQTALVFVWLHLGFVVLALNLGYAGRFWSRLISKLLFSRQQRQGA